MAATTPVRSCGIRNDGSQKIQYNNPSFPLFINKTSLPEDARFSVIDHWHDDFEFIYVVSGSLNYSVEGNNLVISEGNGVFVNSRKLHVVSRTQDFPSVFHCIILHPVLLSSSTFVDEKYVEPILKNNSISFLLLDKEIDWHKKILDALFIISQSTSIPGAALLIQQQFFGIWYNMFTNLEKEENVTHSNHKLTTLKSMISYIHNHYPERITLDDIAAAGNVGKTMCITIFNDYASKTPMEFLKEFRIQQSIEKLIQTDMSITDIAYETGFGAASYYTKIFRESVGTTPLNYRRRSQ